MNRRRFLAAASLGTAAWAFTGVEPFAFSGASVSSFAHRQVLHVFPQLRHTHAVGTRYLSLYPEEASTDFLLARLCEDKVVFNVILKSNKRYPSDELVLAFDAKIREDFAQEDTVQVAGWILSRTEARLCALAALA